jgi:hypothetical protein
MAATHPMKASDLVGKYGWQIMPYLSNLGVTLLSEAQILFVDSGATEASDADDGVHGHSFETPLATIDYAIGLCTADQGDVILVSPGHTETISSAAGIDLDVDDVTIIGVGVNDKRPKISFSAEASTFEINADNVTVKNLQFVGTKTGGTTVGIDIKTGSDYVTIEDCKFYETANTLELLTVITAEDKTDYLTIRNCEFLNLAGGDNLSALATEGDEHDFLVVEGCKFIGDWTNACLDLDADAIVYPLIRDCVLVNVDATAGKAITLNASTVAMMSDLRVATGKGDGYPVSDVSASFETNCYACEAGALGYLGMGSQTATDLSA